MPRRRCQLSPSLLGALLPLFLMSKASAQDAAPPPPGDPPLLQQLSDETQQVYSRIRSDLVRVQLPMSPRWLSHLQDQQRLLDKWGSQLRPDVREKLTQQLARVRAQLHASTRPTTRPGAPAGAAGTLAVTATGLLIDASGHALLPVFVERETVQDIDLPAELASGLLLHARVLGSDRQTNLSLLQLDLHDLPAPLPPPVTFAPSPPAEGQIVLLFSADGMAQVVLWDEAHIGSGVVVTPAGSVAGFDFGNGQFLSAAACIPIAHQLISAGEVHRPVLGVWVRDVAMDDPMREIEARLGRRRALYVAGVQAQSAAARAGLRQGDLIIAAAGQPVVDTVTFAAVIATAEGNETPLVVLRGQNVLTLHVQWGPSGTNPTNP